MQSEDKLESSKELFEVYDGYARTLRTWLVTYGIGAPVIFLTNDSLREDLVSTGSARAVGSWFLVGVAIQVVIAAMNKAAMWGCYYGKLNKNFRLKIRFKIANWLARQFWIDLLADLATITLFTYSTVSVFTLVTNP